MCGRGCGCGKYHSMDDAVCGKMKNRTSGSGRNPKGTTKDGHLRVIKKILGQKWPLLISVIEEKKNPPDGVLEGTNDQLRPRFSRALYLCV